MIIWGWGKNARKEYGVAGTMRCNRCGTDGAANLVKLYSYFSLFFIPIIPTDENYFIQCRHCGYAVQIFDNNVTKAKDMLETIKNFRKGKITEEEFTKKLKSVKFYEGIDNPNDKWECPHCKYKNLNTTYVCRSCNRSLI